MTDIYARFPMIAAALVHLSTPLIPLRSKNNSPSSDPTERFSIAVDSLDIAVKSGSIPNPRFLECKDRISRDVERAWNHYYRLIPSVNPSGALREAIYGLSSPINGVKPFVSANRKKLVSYAKQNLSHPYLDNVAAFLDEVEPLADLINAAKKVAVKRAANTNSTDDHFVPPPVSSASAKRVRAMLETLVADNFDALVRSIDASYHAQMNYYISMRDKRIAEYAASGNPNRPYTVRQYLKEYQNVDMAFIYLVIDDSSGRESGKMVPNATALISARAQKDAETIRDSFINKNLKKIVSIIDEKEKVSAMTVCEVISRNVVLEGLKGAFRISFADGSGFDFDNSVVWVTNGFGTTYTRFPLTFHDVKLPGGRKMGRPSEERMNTIFLGKAE